MVLVPGTTSAKICLSTGCIPAAGLASIKSSTLPALFTGTKISVSHLFKFWHGRNNYLIFKYVFWHTIQGKSLYALSPAEFEDCNHYGPVFSLIIAPFAVLPDFIGMLLWLLIS